MPKHHLIWHNADGSSASEDVDCNIWYTSDNHYFHDKMVALRGCKTIEEMNLKMKTGWKGKIDNKDIVILHGDFSWGTESETLALLQELPGNKYFIEGNHDQQLLGSPACRAQFRDIWVRKELTIDRRRIVMDHYPIRRRWNGSYKGVFHTYGHIHSSYADNAKTEGRCMDVGVDARPLDGQGYLDLLPWSWEEVEQLLSQKPIS